MNRRQFLKSGLCLLAGSVLAALYFPFRKLFAKNNPKRKIVMSSEPSYLALHEKGVLKKRADTLWEMMRECNLCPRECGARRLDGQEGFCRASSQLEISSAHPHFGEEPPLVGTKGSGTIFFTNCSLRCVFCINSDISHLGLGKKASVDDLVSMMMSLQKQGCHNINFVTPTHYVPHIVAAVDRAVPRGLRLPLVYNTCGWENLKVLKLLDGIIDVYLPDFKYSSGNMAAKYSADAFTYPQITQKSFLEMNRQVGVARPGPDGLIKRGFMVRHLVMPNDVSGTKEIFKWIANNLPKNTYLNIMSQYTPVYKAKDYPDIARRITRKEYSDAVRWAKEFGLQNLEVQGL